MDFRATRSTGKPKRRRVPIIEDMRHAVCRAIIKFRLNVQSGAKVEALQVCPVVACERSSGFELQKCES